MMSAISLEYASSTRPESFRPRNALSAIAWKLLASSILSAGLVTSAHAQSAAGKNAPVAPSTDASQGPVKQRAELVSDADIIVTARRSQERLLDVPVAVSALTSESIARYASSDLTSIAGQVVGVQLDRAGQSTSGGSFSIRGVGNLANDLGNEQPVALNFDGMQLTRGRVASLAQFDIQRVEVLKGPQALFFGKNSPAGVVSVLSQSPKIGGPVEGYVQGQFQFRTNTPAVEGAITLPISDTLALRIAGRASTQKDGYVRNVAKAQPDVFDDPTGALGLKTRGASDKYLGGNKVVGLRGTLVWQPSSQFTATLKSLYSVERLNNGTGLVEVISCGAGHSSVSTYGLLDPTGDCTGNRRVSNSAPPTEISKNLYRAPEDGDPFSRTRVWLSTLNMDWVVGDVTLTSVTGYFDFKNDAFDNFDASSWAQATNSQHEVGWQFTQEVRAVSSFDGPLNFSAGLFYQKDERDLDVGTKIAPLGPFNSGGNPALARFDGLYDTVITTAHNTGDTYSGFAQLRWKIVEKLELAGGARWTHESKKTDLGNPLSRLSVFSPSGFRYTPTFSGNNVSPEVTLTWKPERNITVYGAYKTGYLSGGSSNPSTVSNYSTLADPNSAFKYDDETVKGGEVGVKASLFGGRLTGDITAYRYNYKGLQVQTFSAITTSFTTQNAGSARNQGIEAQAVFRATPDLTLRAAASYADLKFTDYDGAQCYSGQTVLPAPGSQNDKQSGNCYALPTGGRARYMTGLRYGPAPFQAILGLTYDRPITETWGLGLTVDGYFYNRTPSYLIPYSPGGSPHQLMNASIRLHKLEGPGLEVALIGTNLFNSGWYRPAGTDKPLGIAGDLQTLVEPPRLITLQATFRF